MRDKQMVLPKVNITVIREIDSKGIPPGKMLKKPKRPPGQKAVDLTVLHPQEISGRRGTAIWRCRCSCEKEADAASDDMGASNDRSSGCKGVSRKRDGRYCAMIGFNKKIRYLEIFEDYESSVETRKMEEELNSKGYLRSYSVRKKMNDGSSGCRAKYPFLFDVSKVNGEIVIRNSMKEPLLIDSG